MDQGEPIPFDIADLHRELSELYLEQGNLENSAHHLQRGRELGEKAELPVLRYRLCIAQARLSKAQADLSGSLAMLDEAERLYVRSPLPEFSPVSAMRARIWVAQDKLTKALEWGRERCLSLDDGLSYLREFEHITWARILLAQYQKDRTAVSIDELERFMERLLQGAEEGNRTGSAIEVLILRALAHQAQGNTTPAFAALERALTLAEPEGFARVFFDEGEVMRLLIERHAHDRSRPTGNYARALLAAFPQPLGASRSAVIHQQPEMIEPLSERELEVLKRLRGDSSGPEIAQQLIVSLNTLRTHTKNIFTKLGVNSRRAAIRRAEELDLF
jgi:LuxR family maltose regulon positive regulatory protein